MPTQGAAPHPQQSGNLPGNWAKPSRNALVVRVLIQDSRHDVPVVARPVKVLGYQFHL